MKLLQCRPSGPTLYLTNNPITNKFICPTHAHSHCPPVGRKHLHREQRVANTRSFIHDTTAATANCIRQGCHDNFVCKETLLKYEAGDKSYRASLPKLPSRRLLRIGWPATSTPATFVQVNHCSGNVLVTVGISVHSIGRA